MRTLALAVLASLAALAPGVARAGGDGLAQEVDPTQARGAAEAETAAVASAASPALLEGRWLGLDVASRPEDPLLGPGRAARLYAVAATPADVHPERTPLVLVHGIHGDFECFAPVVERLARDDRFQLYVLAYADWKELTSRNGVELADQLRALAKDLGPGRDLAILAHSMGGLVTRRALDELAAGPGAGIESWRSVRVLAVDTPWHGFFGPADNWVMKHVVARFMPEGLQDMRARSKMFAGDPGSDDAAARAGMFGTELPASVKIHLVFAQEGSQASDYTEKPVSPVVDALARHYAAGAAVEGSPQVMNFYEALAQSEQFPAFDAALASLGPKADHAAVLAALEERFPRYPGDHVSVLAGPHVLDWLLE